MAAAIVLPDEPEPSSSIQQHMFAGPLIAPAHWPVEIGNSLLQAIRRGRPSLDATPAAIARLTALRVSISAPREPLVRTNDIVFAQGHGLTLYDAAYLLLASDHGAALASNDRDLIRAARALGVPVLTSLA